MGNPVLMEVVGRLEQETRLHKAEQDRLVRLARAARGQRERLDVRALAWLAQRLIAWGQNLQRNGGETSDACALAPANAC
jgi:hypothetical protein